MALILEIFESIQKDTNAMQNLVSIGIKVSEVIDFKSRCPTFKDFMDILPIIEHEVHRNNPSEFKTKLIEAHCFEVIDRTVWPHDLLYGMLYGVAGLYHSEHDYHVERVKIELDPETGDEIGIYHITW